MLEQRIGLIGAGQMATALAGGFIKAGLTAADRILASDVDELARQRFTEATAAPTTPDNAAVVARSDVIVLAVKPQQMENVAAGLRGKIGTSGSLCRSRPAFGWPRWPGGLARNCGSSASCRILLALSGRAPAPTAWANMPRPKTAAWWGVCSRRSARRGRWKRNCSMRSPVWRAPARRLFT